MGTLRKNINQHFRSKSSFKTKQPSKGVRLGWSCVNDKESFDLNKLLSKGEEIDLKNNKSPMLVP